MAMSRCGTFDYVVTLPDPSGAVFSANASLREPVVLLGDARRDNRLVGHVPRCEISSQHVVLSAAAPEFSEVAQARFEVDPGLLSMLCAQDRLYLVRTS